VQKVPIRVKLGATLLVPVLALVVVAALEMLAAKNENDRVHNQAELAAVSLGPPSVLIQLELERNIAATYILGSEDLVALSVENKEEAWANTDVSVEDFRSAVQDRGGFVAETYAPVIEALGGLEDLRRQTAEYDGPRELASNPVAREIFDGYSAIMDVVYDANAQILPTIANRDLRRGAELADLSARQSDTTARILRELLRANFEGESNGIDTSPEIASLAAVLGELQRNAEAIDAKAEGPYRDLADQLFATEHISAYPELIEEALRGDDPDMLTTLNTSTGSESGEFGYTVFGREVAEQLRDDTNQVRSDADARFLRYGLLASAAVLLALATTWLVSQSLTRPLRSLTRQAKTMASDRLPNAVRSILNTPLGEDVEVPEMAPVRVKTRDEVGDVAEALNTVQETALELAVEQAVLRRNIADSFVNLGRRNQNLLGRQLDFITELESNETDPDTLASLFRLDHLATRMRRNAESLLVLAGIDPPRRWSAPVRLTDVIRAALGEVEDYQRVTVLGVEPAMVVGSAAADLAHLCAEFVENALTFSPPDQNVEVRGRHRPDGYTLAIIDNGFGMAPEDIERANRRLAGSESFTIAPSKYLGHYVAGNLAARHDVTVRLEPSPGSGVTAMIHLPPSLLAADATPAASAMPGVVGGESASLHGAVPAGARPVPEGTGPTGAASGPTGPAGASVVPAAVGPTGPDAAAPGTGAVAAGPFAGMVPGERGGGPAAQMGGAGTVDATPGAGAGTTAALPFGPGSSPTVGPEAPPPGTSTFGDLAEAYGSGSGPAAGGVPGTGAHAVPAGQGWGSDAGADDTHAGDATRDGVGPAESGESFGSHWAPPGHEPQPGDPDGDPSTAGGPGAGGAVGFPAGPGAPSAPREGEWPGRAREPAARGGGPGLDRPGGTLGPEPLTRTDSGRTGRTASGLTKRTPRQGGPSATVPQGELLDALSRASRSADRRPGRPSGPVGLSPALPPPGARMGTPGGPGAPGAVPSQPAAPGTGAGTGVGGRADAPPAAAGWGDRPSDGIPPAPDTTAPPPLAARRGPGRRGLTRPGSGLGGPVGTGAANGREADSRGRSGPATTPAGGGEQGQTPSGLARRVPGAHLPSNGPILIPRSDRDPGVAPGAGGSGSWGAQNGATRPGGTGGAGGPDAPAGPNDVTGSFRFGEFGDTPAGDAGSVWSAPDRRAGGPTPPPEASVPPGLSPVPPRAGNGDAEGTERAESVYSLLTSFTVGVQRGLDEAATGHSGSTSDRS
jgi:signal transduction histidine kinase